MEMRVIDAPESQSKDAPRIWPSRPPAGCPFAPSDAFNRFGFTGQHKEYQSADTWYPCWAADNKLYSPWTDGVVDGTESVSFKETATTGHAIIEGDDPFSLKVVEHGLFASKPNPYRGRYPCGSLVQDGVWYYGTYCLAPREIIKHDDGATYNWPWLGPLVGFRWSTDFGKTWHETPHTPDHSLFNETGLHGEPVKIGAAHFVDFGKAMEHSPDGKAYLVSHGASDGKSRRYRFNSWITGDEIYLIRVTPSVENMNDASKYEFFAGHDADGRPVWSRDFKAIKPIAAWRDNMGCVTMTYNAPLKKYLMCVTDGVKTMGYFNTYILESDNITGPFKLVTYMKQFGEEAYFVNFPSKFISPDGRTLWLCYSANFGNGWTGLLLKPRPRGSGYCMCLQEVKLIRANEPPLPTSALESADNIARDAKVTVSSLYDQYDEVGAVDGIVGGFPENVEQEWASNGEGQTAMIRLNWDKEQSVDRVWLFDRPNALDQIKAGMLIFSDGTTIATSELPDDARHGLEVRFPAKQIKWLIFSATAVKEGTPNIGLSEIAVFGGKN